MKLPALITGLFNGPHAARLRAGLQAELNMTPELALHGLEPMDKALAAQGRKLQQLTRLETLIRKNPSLRLSTLAAEHPGQIAGYAGTLAGGAGLGAAAQALHERNTPTMPSNTVTTKAAAVKVANILEGLLQGARKFGTRFNRGRAMGGVLKNLAHGSEGRAALADRIGGGSFARNLGAAVGEHPVGMGALGGMAAMHGVDTAANALMGPKAAPQAPAAPQDAVPPQPAAMQAPKAASVKMAGAAELVERIRNLARQGKGGIKNFRKGMKAGPLSGRASAATDAERALLNAKLEHGDIFHRYVQAPTKQLANEFSAAGGRLNELDQAFNQAHEAYIDHVRRQGNSLPFHLGSEHPVATIGAGAVGLGAAASGLGAALSGGEKKASAKSAGIAGEVLHGANKIPGVLAALLGAGATGGVIKGVDSVRGSLNQAYVDELAREAADPSKLQAGMGRLESMAQRGGLPEAGMALLRKGHLQSGMSRLQDFLAGAATPEKKASATNLIVNCWMLKRALDEKAKNEPKPSPAQQLVTALGLGK